ncbi:hypothetical protein SAMN05444266_106260 [Chitinophaga jiangningensis]|uniref:Uncharacterized protein n=1 Tax=Chitinophaga jiangningensis TaxID=1419482 RepID=A0A1M7FTN0_9BACT|nr:hypothetical protein [Chitinophaga jiangningensis]SHM07037.1 hypothetical protein SAMN05444266_106260 [Chitinophaga jiangningensis]
MRLFLLICITLLFASCHPAVERHPEPAFYFWKQSWTGNPVELQYLRQLPAQKLYIKMFDVTPDAVSGKPIPVAVFNQQVPLPAEQPVVPVVFIMNEVWAQLKDSLAMADFTGKTTRLLESLTKTLPGKSISEIQIDCDWTQTSSSPYFNYLTKLKEQPFFKGKTISATIRMHQVKYRTSSGTPPVDKGLLMCYNMGDLRKAGDHNSILDLETMKAYIGSDRISNYPLPLDIALPLFNWTVLFEQGQYKGILRNIGETELSNHELFIPQGKQLFVVKNDTLINGYLLRKGSELRREITNVKLLKSAANLLAEQKQDYSPTIIFYHLDAATLKNYPLHELQEIYRLFN